MKEKESLISIIILNYNAGNLLLECVESIFNSNYNNLEVIVVDNVSNDNSHKICKEKFANIVLIENEKNLGYCGGNNIGIEHANGEFVVILNPDVIVESDWLNQLLIAFRKYGDGLYQPKILATTDHNTIISTGNMIQLFGFGFSRGKGEKDVGQFEKDEEVGYASGTCLFSSADIFRKIGNFDSFLFAYHDDLDLCWRGRLKGIKSFYVHKSIIYHPLEGYSFKWNSFKFFLMERNRLYCLKKNFSRKTIFKMLPSLILVEIAVTLFYLKKGFVSAKIKANLDILKNLNTISRNHNLIQKNRIVNDDEIIKKFVNKIEVPKWVIEKENNNLLNKIFEKLSVFSRLGFK
ncbi:glycosyltransferase, group 2 family protein [Candidatus Nitrosopumilus salaria BD31]|uniref:Glycosyltransferase, group 2 family protein n=1 Tax=Candidatus Nitrosopumilus salarius BD31 TaxID=859350 RepID=I3D5B2_9ARCH|nr:glycosyltransferase family 2 protein [Candidatus Nitrosopumilus salaria]EIJ66905.1 glycosyltransferase, group 2 family protein [Candidatus Nitrosopumilus salaria BD31]